MALKRLYSFKTRIGFFYIVSSDDGEFHTTYNDQTLGKYSTADQAAKDLACGHTFSLTAGLGIPETVSEWERC